MIQFIDTDYTFSKEKIYKQLHLKNSRAEKRIDDVFPELVRQTKEHLDITACWSVDAMTRASTLGDERRLDRWVTASEPVTSMR